MFEELEQKFNKIQTKIELKQHSINESYQREIKALNDNYNEQNLEEKYSRELNLYRDELLKQKETKMRLEIDQANMETKQIKNLEFKRGVVKSAKISIRQLIKKEIKLNKIFSISQLIKYKNNLGLNKVIQTVNQSIDTKVLSEAMFASVKKGSLEMAILFVEYGADMNANEYGKTASMLASGNGHLKIVKCLIEHVNANYDIGRTALMNASER